MEIIAMKLHTLIEGHFKEVQCTWLITLTLLLTELFIFVKISCPEHGISWTTDQNIALKLHKLTEGI